jgi:hypothetical protein
MHKLFECNFFTFLGENCSEKSRNKIRPQSGAPVFAPDYSTTALAAKM